jgi:hypothetical protein
VPFKPTQGRPVLCRQCFQLKRVPSAVAAVATMNSPAGQIAVAAEAFAAANDGEVLGDGPLSPSVPSAAATVEMIAQSPPESLGETAAPLVVELAVAETADA